MLSTSDGQRKKAPAEAYIDGCRPRGWRLAERGVVGVPEGGKVVTKTHERIFKVADEIGHLPNIHARSLITRRTGMIALVMGDITDPFYPEVLEILASKPQTAGERAVCSTYPR